MDSAPGGLDKLKLQNGYIPRNGFVGGRKSTGLRDSGQLLRAETRKQSDDDVKLNYREEQRDRNGGRKEKEEDELVDGWPKWLTDNIPKEVLAGIVPKSADNYDKIEKVGQGTYSNVYKARDRDTGKIVALKKVRFDTSEPESVKFMAREIMILQKLDHPNVVKLEGLATSRMHYSIYLVFDFMQSDLARIICRPDARLTEPQVKCYMHQLLSGLQHCHEKGILHRDIKGSNLLIDRNGMLKIADFGLANYYTQKRRLTSRVVTLWYRAPELLLGATDYGVGIDLWSAGCLLAEMFAGHPIMPGRTEVEQLHRIFKLCGTPSEEYWRKLKSTKTFRPPQTYKPSLFHAFSDFPESSLGLLSKLLALDPAQRGTAASALQDEFFYTKPLACDLSGLPVIRKEEDEVSQTNERRRRKMKHRSRTQLVRRTKDINYDKPTENSASQQLVVEKILELDLQGHQRANGTAGHSYRVNLMGHQRESPSDVAHQEVESTSSEGHPSPNKIIVNRPSRPASRPRATNYPGKDKDGINKIHRSTSTREYGKLGQTVQRKYSKLHKLDD